MSLGAGPRAPKQERSRRTRARILKAATGLFLERGYPATTMTAIADASEVSVQSLYLRFGAKLQILAAASDVAIVGDDEEVPLLERQWFAEMRAAPDGSSAIAIFISEMARLMQRTYPLYAVIRSVAAGEAGDLLESNKHQRYEGLSAVATALSKKPGLRAGLTTSRSADLLYALVSEDHYGLLVAERGWAPDEWKEWCAEALSRALFDSPTGQRLTAAQTLGRKKGTGR